MSHWVPKVGNSRSSPLPFEEETDDDNQPVDRENDSDQSKDEVEDQEVGLAARDFLLLEKIHGKSDHDRRREGADPADDSSRS